MNIKKIIFLVSFLTISIFIFLVWYQPKPVYLSELTEYEIESKLKLDTVQHEELHAENIKSILVEIEGQDNQLIFEKESIEELIRIFNEYHKRAIQELNHELYEIKGKIVFELNDGEIVVVYYASGLVHVKRTDIDREAEVSYTILDDKSELETYFRNMVSQ